MAVFTVFQNKWKALREELRQLNLFDTYSRDPILIRQQILTTRLFLVLFTISFLVLLLYTSISPHAINVTVERPSQTTFEKLQTKYSDTLQCPCTRISIPYEVFVRVSPSFHQVCSSQFVSQEWIDYVFEMNSEFLWPMDVRRSLSAMWQMIASLCHNALESIDNVWNEFANQVLITSMALSRQSLEAKTRAAIDTMHQTALYNLARSLTLVHRISQANGYLTGTSMNFIVAAGGTVVGDSNGLFMVDTKYNYVEDDRWCLCQRYGSCPVKAGFYRYDRWETTGVYSYAVIRPNQTLDGLYVDCLPLLMASGSTLECFYNRSCLDILLSIHSRRINISVLDTTLQSHFPPNTLIANIINELFLETITNETIFESYYERCAPSYCSYIYTTRFEWVYVVTTLAALLGGLNVAFRLLSPRLISLTFWFRKRLSQQEESKNEQVQNQATFIQPPMESNSPLSFVTKMMIVFNEFDLFQNYHAKDAYDIKHTRFITRLYIISLIISMTILIIYTSQTVNIFSKKLLTPTQEQYEHLHNEYPNTLQCPCNTISIPYASIMSIKPTFHQLCYSDFIQPWWYQSQNYHWALTGSFDFRFISASYFRTLAMFCEISNITINAAYHRFLSTAFVNSQVIHRNTFLAQTKSFISNFINATLLDFLYQVSLVNNMLHAQQYASGMETNTFFLAWQITEERIVNERPLQISPVTWSAMNNDGSTCYCALNASCPTTNSRYIMFNLPGMYIACFLVDTVLKSTLECWYDRACINSLIQAFNESRLWVDVPQNTTALNTNLPSQFSPYTIFENIVNHLMVEYYNYSSSYDSFYEICQPLYCSYTYQEYSDMIYMITTIIGLFGGMNIVLRLTSRSIANVVHRRSKHQQNIAPTISEQQNDPKHLDKLSYNQQSKWSVYLTKFNQLNLFENGSIQIHTVYRQRNQTRLYITLLIFSIMVITLYTVIPKQGAIKTIDNPSFIEYINLKDKYGDGLQCPCDRISIPNRVFTNVTATFHQVCFSDFVESTWINSIFLNSYWLFYARNDFTIRGAAYYTFLAKLCQLVQKNIDQAISDFLDEEFQSSDAISELTFHTHMTSAQEQFRLRTIRQFSQAWGLFRNMTHASTFVSSYFLNWYSWINSGRPHATLPISPVIMDNQCSCGTRNDCVEQGAVFDAYTDGSTYWIPGLRVGCSVVESLFLSSLECIYNQRCVDMLVYIYSMPAMTALNTSVSSRFDPTTSVADIAAELFIEEWQSDFSYVAFYEACAPKSCSYSRAERRQILFLISRILALYGGLSIVLRFLTPYLFLIIETIHHRLFRKSRVEPIA